MMRTISSTSSAAAAAAARPPTSSFSAKGNLLREMERRRQSGRGTLSVVEQAGSCPRQKAKLSFSRVDF